MTTIRSKPFAVGAAFALVLMFGRSAFAYDYETCFAFDPVFVQADQRRVASPVPRAEQASKAQEERKTSAPPLLRLSLRTLVRALQDASQETEKAPRTTAGGGDAR